MQRTRTGLRALVASMVVASGVASCSSSGGSASGHDASSGAIDSGTPGVDATTGGRTDAGKGGAKDATTDAKGGKKDAGFVSHDAGTDCGGRTGNPCGDGAPCTAGTDCQSGFCTGGVCVAPPPTCTDGTKDGQETDVDCGGAVCAPCAPGKACLAAVDCTSDVCTGGVCQAPSATDGVKNDSETDVDCGGALQADGTPNPAADGAPACVPGKQCALPSDCVQGVCDGTPVASGDAGPDGAVATVGDGGDAGSALLYCQPASPTDGVKNDSETDVDCGGGFLAGGAPNPASDGAPVCTHGQSCLLGTDCDQRVCNANNDAGGGPVDCPTGATCTCQLPSPTDTVKNDGETDVDCGGGNAPGSDGAPPCAPGLRCLGSSDCQSFICATTGLCTAPTPTDGVKNDSETDVDCGGAKLADGTANPASDGAPRCHDEKTCAIDQDCLSGFCSLISHTCVDGQSCKGLVTPAQIMDPTGQVDANGDAIGAPDPNGVGQSAGLDTCGVGEATDPPASQQHESCCRSLVIPSMPTVRLDKYIVTSGRMRQFLESLNYDVRDWAIAQFDANWNPITPAGTMMASQLPVNKAGTTNALTFLPKSADTAQPLNAVLETGALVLDTAGLQGCFTGNGYAGAATYWWNAETIYTEAASPPRPFTQDYYDIKPMNCVPYFLAAAFCAWDGGRIMLQSEHTAVWGSQTYPWGPALIPTPYPGNTTMYNNASCGSLSVNGAVKCTIDWANGYGGDFYYYPSYPASIPNAFVPDSLTHGLDLSVLIGAPGRFFLDRTTVKSTSFAGNEGWQDLGANMLELAPGSALTGGGAFNDDSGILANGENYTCGTNCVTRGTGLPAVDLLGGSWEGHGPTENYCTDCWSVYRQYGKTGIRCARPVEPAQ